MERDMRIMSGAINRAYGRTTKTPLYATMYSNFKTMSEQALFAPDETYASRSDRYLRIPDTQQRQPSEQMSTRRLHFGCTAGRA
jgi:hypothetical protein